MGNTKQPHNKQRGGVHESILKQIRIVFIEFIYIECIFKVIPWINLQHLRLYHKHSPTNSHIQRADLIWMVECGWRSENLSLKKIYWQISILLVCREINFISMALQWHRSHKKNEMNWKIHDKKATKKRKIYKNWWREKAFFVEHTFSRYNESLMHFHLRNGKQIESCFLCV